MKPGIRHLYRGMGLGLVCTVLAACNAETESGTGYGTENIRVYTGIQNTGSEGSSRPVTGEEVKACLIFWRATTYDDHILQGDWPTYPPYLTARPENPINAYTVETGIPYDTRHSYPTGGQHVHVAGFAPAELEEYAQETYYRTIPIPAEMQDGKVDFLSGDGNSSRTGSANEPFVTDMGGKTKEDKQLEFCHLTAKIGFEARRASTMANRIGVRNVEIKLKGQKVPTALEWKKIEGMEKGGGYFPIASEKTADITLKAPKDEPVALYTSQKVDSCYVYAEGGHFHGDKPDETNGAITLEMDISADLLPFKGNDWDESQVTRREWKGRTVTIDSKTGNALRMGYAYKVTITFNIWDIRLQGMEVDWYSGGRHYIPITPEEKDKESDQQPKV